MNSKTIFAKAQGLTKGISVSFLMKRFGVTEVDAKKIKTELPEVKKQKMKIRKRK